MPRRLIVTPPPVTTPIDALLASVGITSDVELARRNGPAPRTMRSARRGRIPRRDVVQRLATVIGVPLAVVELAFAETANAARRGGAS